MILQSPPRRQPRQNERTNATSDRAAAQVSRTLAAARPAAGLEPRAAADEAQAAQRLLAAGPRELQAGQAREPPAARPLLAARGEEPPARASSQEPTEARTGREPLARVREAQAGEPERAGLRPAAELRHWAWAPGCLLALAAPASGLEQGPLVQ